MTIRNIYILVRIDYIPFVCSMVQTNKIWKWLMNSAISPLYSETAALVGVSKLDPQTSVFSPQTAMFSEWQSMDGTPRGLKLFPRYGEHAHAMPPCTTHRWINEVDIFVHLVCTLHLNTCTCTHELMHILFPIAEINASKDMNSCISTMRYSLGRNNHLMKLL